MIGASVRPGRSACCDFSYDITSMSAQICKLAADNKGIIYAHYIMRVASQQRQMIGHRAERKPKAQTESICCGSQNENENWGNRHGMDLTAAVPSAAPPPPPSPLDFKHTFFPSLTLRRRNLHADEVKPAKKHAYLVTELLRLRLFVSRIRSALNQRAKGKKQTSMKEKKS